MLVLTRKTNETVILTVGDVTIEVVVTRIDAGRVQLGFNAPPSVAILRDNAVNKLPPTQVVA